MDNESNSRKLTQDEFTRIYLAAEMMAQTNGGTAVDHFQRACMNYIAFLRQIHGNEFWHLEASESDYCRRFAYRLDSEGNLERIVSTVFRADWSDPQKR